MMEKVVMACEADAQSRQHQAPSASDRDMRTDQEQPTTPASSRPARGKPAGPGSTPDMGNGPLSTTAMMQVMRSSLAALQLHAATPSMVSPGVGLQGLPEND